MNDRHLHERPSMGILSRFRLRTKLALLLATSTMGMIAIIGINAASLHHHLREGRIDKLKSVVDATIAVAADLERKVAANQITREQELKALGDVIHAHRRVPVSETRPNRAAAETILRPPLHATERLPSGRCLCR